MAHAGPAAVCRGGRERLRRTGVRARVQVVCRRAPPRHMHGDSETRGGVGGREALDRWEAGFMAGVCKRVMNGTL